MFDATFAAYTFIQSVGERYACCIPPTLSLEPMTSLDFVFRSPVLGAPPEIFFNLVRGIELIQKGEKLSLEDEMSIWKLYNDVRGWELILDARGAQYKAKRRLWMGKIYAVTTRVILSHILCASALDQESEYPHLSELRATMDEARRILEMADDYLERSWTKYILWPVAIIGAVTLRRENILIIRRLLQRSGERSYSNTATLIEAALVRIWSDHLLITEQESVSASMNALRSLLSGTIISQTIESMSSPNSNYKHMPLDC